MTEIWDLVILNPILNSLIALSTFLFDNFGLAVIVLTIVVRLILFPLTVRQTQSTQAMQLLQPRIQELQKKYARDQRRLQAEMMNLYKEAGINPIGCLWPMLIQFPVWIALYQSIIMALASSPENLLELSQRLYSWPMVTQAIPLNEQFLWLQLSKPDPYLILAILVGGTMWVQQKMVTPPATDPRQKSMTQMTTLMMPLMFGMFTLSFPSGLSLYWAVSNIIGIVIQYFIGGWGYLVSPTGTGRPNSPRKVLPPGQPPSKVIDNGLKKKKGLFGK
jgi:YidC/Oxa1 family membrane protein insertase